jgi:hypothetical protein
MEQLIKQAEELLKAIKNNEKQIDNPVLTLSIKAEISNFIEYLKDED